ncbi:MAG TPA: AAA family ATPase, partial [Pseudomonadota bacterium]|nr:AAA family ATPase [Pseudomonadota bacterium]
MLRAFLPVGYRNLRTDAKNLVGLGRINLLVGPNNSGKSNYIRALGFLRDMLLCDGGSTSFLQTVEKHGRAEVVNR